MWPPDYRPQHKRNAFAGFSRHWKAHYESPSMNQRDLVWVHKRHCPDDARSIFPARSAKPLAEKLPAPKPVPSYWVQTPEAPLGTFSRQDEEDKHFRSSHGRCFCLDDTEFHDFSNFFVYLHACRKKPACRLHSEQSTGRPVDELAVPSVFRLLSLLPGKTTEASAHRHDSMSTS